MKFGVVIFPGSNCDQDIIHVLRNVLHYEVDEIWHQDHRLDGFTTNDCIVLPGGFSYGDYLRPGAISRFSPVMEQVISFAKNGGYVLGICNGFQMLCEAQLLPGALVRNINQKFICKNTYIRVETTSSPLTHFSNKGDALSIPVAHADGRYYADQNTVSQLHENNQILFRYCTANGEVTNEANINGSVDNIAGISNKNGNVLGMMPHPERASEEVLGNVDGRALFESLYHHAEEMISG